MKHKIFTGRSSTQLCVDAEKYLNETEDRCLQDIQFSASMTRDGMVTCSLILSCSDDHHETLQILRHEEFNGRSELIDEWLTNALSLVGSNLIDSRILCQSLVSGTGAEYHLVIVYIQTMRPG